MNILRLQTNSSRDFKYTPIILLVSNCFVNLKNTIISSQTCYTMINLPTNNKLSIDICIAIENLSQTILQIIKSSVFTLNNKNFTNMIANVTQFEITENHRLVSKWQKNFNPAIKCQLNTKISSSPTDTQDI